MSQEPGDRYFGHGDSTTRTNNSGQTLNQGYWVVPTGNDNIDTADVNASRGDLVGVLADDVDDTNTQNVHWRGIIWARVDSGVTAGNELAAPDSNNAGEVEGVAESGGSTGIYALGDAKDPEGNGNYYAKVLLR